MVDTLSRVSTRAERPEHARMLPLDGSTLETRLAGDYFSLGELIQAMFAALMKESSYRCYTLMEECGDLFHQATESDFSTSSPDCQAAVVRLVYRLFEELDFYNYRFELVKTSTRHR